MDLEFNLFCDDIEEAYGEPVNKTAVLRALVKIGRVNSNFRKICNEDIRRVRDTKSAAAQNKRYHSNHDTSKKSTSVSYELSALHHSREVATHKLNKFEKLLKKQAEASDVGAIYAKAGLLMDETEDMRLKSNSIDFDNPYKKDLHSVVENLAYGVRKNE